MYLTDACAREQTRRCFMLVLLAFIAVVPGARAQVRQASMSSRDTLPLSVAKGSLAAYNRHDIVGLESFYDTLFVHEMLGDTTTRVTVTPQQAVAGLGDNWASSKSHSELRQQIVSGPFVVLFYDFIENGKRTRHMDIYEVRHGKIVYEWDQP